MCSIAGSLISTLCRRYMAIFRRSRAAGSIGYSAAASTGIAASTSVNPPD